MHEVLWESLGRVGRSHVGLESHTVLPDGTQSVSGKAKSSSQIYFFSCSHFFLTLLAIIFGILFALD